MIAHRMAAHYLGENSGHSAAANPAVFQTAKCHEPVLCRGGCARTSTPSADAHSVALLQNAESPALLRGMRWAAQPARVPLLRGHASRGTRCIRRRCFDPQHAPHAASRRTRVAPADSDYETASTLRQGGLKVYGVAQPEKWSGGVVFLPKPLADIVANLQRVQRLHAREAHRAGDGRVAGVGTAPGRRNCLYQTLTCCCGTTVGSDAFRWQRLQLRAAACL